MDSTPQQRFEVLSRLFDELAAIPPGPLRDARLASADESLANEVRRLLRADETVGNRVATAEVPQPNRFGPYEVRELIGAGGMGAVYRATREDGEIRQQVAIKRMAGTLWSPLLDERFRRERQILAELRHPHIARFLDAGVAADSSLYLVMEYVVGDRVDHWCDNHRLPLRARLELFLKICGAVSFAHQKLIVHRDLKPANILVGADGEPKLLDFGVAATLDSTPDDGQRTLTAGLFLTPLYASPELLRGQLTGVTCDVYSLGVLLYELLSGARAFGGSHSSPAEIIERVLSGDPPRLSAAVSAEPAVAAARGASSSAALRRALKGDLEAIVEKAMAKSPTERYASVEQLADDLRSFLNGQPVLAAATGHFYRARKFVLRNKWQVTAVLLLALTLFAGLAGTLWQAAIAQQRFNDARELARYLVFDLPASVEKLSGSTPVRAAMVERSLAYLDRLSASSITDDALRLEVGRGYLQLADVLGNPYRANIGEPLKARESYRKAIAILQPLATKSSDNRQARVALARARLMLGRSLGFGNKSPEGKALVQGATVEFAQLSQRWPSDFEVRSQAAIAYDNFARSLGLSGGSYVTGDNAKPALDAEQQALYHAQAALLLKPGDLDTLRQLSAANKVLGDLTEPHDRPGATRYFRQALAVLNQIPQGDRTTPAARGARASALLGLGWNLGNLGSHEEAIALLREAADLRDWISVQDPKNNGALFFRTIPYRNLGIIHQSAGHMAASREAFLTAIAIYDQLIVRNPENANYRFARAELQANAADLSVELRRLPESRALGAAARSALLAAARQSDADPVQLTIAARHLLECRLPQCRDYPLALTFMERANAKGGDDAEIQEVTAEAYWRTGDRQQAVAAIQRALSLIEPQPTPARRALEKTLEHYQTGRPR